MMTFSPISIIHIFSYLLRTSSSKLKIVETITIIQQMPFLMLPVGFYYKWYNAPPGFTFHITLF